MSQDDLKVRQIATRKNNADNAGGNSGSGTASGSSESRLPVRLDVAAGSSDSLAGWLEAYFAVEVTTAQSSRAVQRRDLSRFLAFMQAEEGSDERSLWTSRLSRAFLDALRNEIDRKRPPAAAVILALALLSGRGAMVFWLADVPGEQVGDAVDGVVGDAGEHVAEPGFRVKEIELGGLEQGVEG